MNYQERDTYGMYDANDQGACPHLMGADTLIGNDVSNDQGENLGDIKEIMLNPKTGQIAYAVLSFGGFLGMGEKLFAVPWGALTIDAENKRFLLDADKEQLKDAPGFDKNNWPDMSDQTWAGQIHTFYGTPYEMTIPEM